MYFCRSVVENHCTTAFNKAVGLKVCADIKVPQVTAAAPFFFLNGQSIASLSIEKTEASMQGYYFMVEGIKGKINKKCHANITE